MSGAIQSPDAVRAMFDRIAPRYDLMNKIMTGGQDERWRAATAKAAVADGAIRALDAATGTGGLARALRRAGADQVTGLDMSGAMLERAAQLSRSVPDIDFLPADVMDLPFDDGTFDACTIGFGLRNLPDYQQGLNELVRILAPGGRLAVLELTPIPPSRFQHLFDLYFERLTPYVGWLISGDREAYRYLPESVRQFPDSRRLAAMMHESGLTSIRWRYFGRGTVALHVGQKRQRGADG